MSQPISVQDTYCHRHHLRGVILHELDAVSANQKQGSLSVALLWFLRSYSILSIRLFYLLESLEVYV